MIVAPSRRLCGRAQQHTRFVDRPMASFGAATPDQEYRRALTRRLAAASVAARAATERYVEIRRKCESTVEESRELLDVSRELREQLRHVVTSYVSILRLDGTPPERVILQVKTAVESCNLSLDARRQRHLMDEVVRWAVDAYYAA